MTAEEFFRNKIKELHPNKEVVTLSQELITAEQGLRWAHEFKQLHLHDVSRRFFVCEDINYLNEMKVISTEFDTWEDADSFRQTMKEGFLYKHKSLLIINVC